MFKKTFIVTDFLVVLKVAVRFLPEKVSNKNVNISRIFYIIKTTWFYHLVLFNFVFYRYIVIFYVCMQGFSGEKLFIIMSLYETNVRKICKKLCNYRKNSFDVSKVRQRFIKGICSPTRYIFAAYCGFINIR